MYRLQWRCHSDLLRFCEKGKNFKPEFLVNCLVLLPVCLLQNFDPIGGSNLARFPIEYQLLNSNVERATVSNIKPELDGGCILSHDCFVSRLVQPRHFIRVSHNRFIPCWTVTNGVELAWSTCIALNSLTQEIRLSVQSRWLPWKIQPPVSRNQAAALTTPSEILLQLVTRPFYSLFRATGSQNVPFCSFVFAGILGSELALF